MLNGIVAHLVANLVVQVVHQPALLNGQNLVERSRDVETYGRNILGSSAFRRGRGKVSHLLLRQITLVGTAEVELVAIFLSMNGTHDGTELWQFHFADAGQLVKYLLLLHA